MMPYATFISKSKCGEPVVIPPFASQLTVKIEQSSEFEKCVDRIEDTDEEDRDAKIKKKLNDWAASIAMEISAPVAKVVEILRRKWLGGPGAEMDTTSMEYRAEEYDALNGSAQGSGRTGDFSRESMTIDEYNLPYLVGISIINKIREVRTLVGFTRVNPGAGKDDPHFVSIKEPETRWYPAYEVRGEGIFIEFSNLLIQQWIAANPQVVERAHTLSVNWSESFIGKSRPRNISAKFLLLHTVAHLLIKQLSFECGYSIASLRERIYCGDEADGKVMSGIFIYTASGDSEGTLGGLVRQGRPDCFGRIFQKAIDSARICSNDPVCILSRGQGRESLNISACHACTLIPETSCEEYNVLLDRGLVVGTFDDPNFGFFQFDFGRHAAEDTKPRAAAVQLVDGEPLVDDYSTWEDYRKSDARLLASSELSRFGEMHVPLADQYDAELRVDGNTVTAFLVWEEHKIVITDGREKPFLRKLAEQSGWTCIPLDDIRATDIIQRVGGANYWQE